jgi:hypothetical protein
MLKKMPIDDILMIYDLKLDIGNLENNIRRVLIYQQIPKITNIELHMGYCELRSFSDNMYQLFEITKATYFSLQSNKLQRYQILYFLSVICFLFTFPVGFFDQLF